MVDNYKFYDGYEGESLITLAIKGEEGKLYIWDGYFEDIFGKPNLNREDWCGFTRDYQLLEGAFLYENKNVSISPKEYLEDLKQYLNKEFQYEETKELLVLIKDLLEKAIKEDKEVIVCFE